MTDSLTPLSKLDNDDVLQDLYLRVEQMEESSAQGYDTCKNFYKRIIDRIEKADDVAIVARSNAGKMFKRVQDSTFSYTERDEMLQRAEEDMNYLEEYLVTLEDDPVAQTMNEEEF